jgi:hypothetical protein
VLTMFPDPQEKRAHERVKREIAVGGFASPSE